MTGQAVYSPGYQLTLWLGSGQLRLWRRVDRLLGSRSSRSTTVRAIAAELGVNPGSVSRDLGRLSSLGFVARSTTRGRLGGVELWRVVARRIRGLDPRRRARALGRMGAPVPGQLALSIAEEDREPRAWWDTEPDDPDEPELGAPAAAPGGRGVPEVATPGAGSPAPVARSPEPGSLRAERDPVTPQLDGELAGQVQAELEPYRTIRCSCGRLRVVRTAEPTPACEHGRR